MQDSLFTDAERSRFAQQWQEAVTAPTRDLDVDDVRRQWRAATASWTRDTDEVVTKPQD